jgi:hypothetical protein
MRNHMKTLRMPSLSTQSIYHMLVSNSYVFIRPKLGLSTHRISVDIFKSNCASNPAWPVLEYSPTSKIVATGTLEWKNGQWTLECEPLSSVVSAWGLYVPGTSICSTPLD